MCEDEDSLLYLGSFIYSLCAVTLFVLQLAFLPIVCILMLGQSGRTILFPARIVIHKCFCCVRYFAVLCGVESDQIYREPRLHI